MPRRDGTNGTARAVFVFPPFRLDAAQQQLWRVDELVPIKPKPFAVLLHLLEHAGKLVDKDELLRLFWGGVHIGDGVLKSHIREIRQALGDGAQQARFIETVRSRGYRFVGALERSAPLNTPSPALPQRRLSSPPTHCTRVIGRQAELDILTRCWVRAREGQRQIVLVVGEAGIGKSALVTAWLHERSADREKALIMWGQCVDQYGSGEPYLPILEALTRACRGDAAERVIHTLRRHAPDWCIHVPSLPPLLSEAPAPPATPERMLGQMADMLEALAQEHPLALLLEDLHWADHSTLDLLTYLARRSDPAQLLLLATYRSGEAMARLEQLQAALGARNQCVTLRLPCLSSAAIGAYLTQRLGPHQLPGNVATLLQLRTEGNPLFMVGVVDGWLERGLLTTSSTGCELNASLDELGRAVPESFMSMIQRELDRASPFERSVLEAASVVGREFTAAAVAAALGVNTLEIEDLGMRWSLRGHILRAEGSSEWNDGTVSQRFGFVHVLYQQVIYDQIGAGRQAQWHRRVAERLEAGHADEARHTAPELALHFEKARDYESAVRYSRASGEQAASRGSYHGALEHVTHALELTARLPEDERRAQIELELLILSATLLRITKGFAAPEVEQAYARAAQASDRLQATAALLSILAGTGAIYVLRGSPRVALELGQRFLLLAKQLGDPSALNEAHLVLGVSQHALGRHSDALHHFDQVLAPQESNRQTAPMSLGGRNPVVVARCFSAFSRCIMGNMDRALAEVEEALELANELADPFAMCHALNFCGHVRQLRRELDAAGRHVDALAAVAKQYGLAMFAALAVIQSGRNDIEQGDASSGLTRLERGWAELDAMGVRLYRKQFVSLLAVGRSRTGQRQLALEILDEALARRDREDERVWDSELLRTRAELLVVEGAVAEAERDLLEALELAREQRARLFELRAATSLAKHWQNHRVQEAHALLSGVYAAFSEGLTTGDLVDARRLLDELRAAVKRTVAAS